MPRWVSWDERKVIVLSQSHLRALRGEYRYFVYHLPEHWFKD